MENKSDIWLEHSESSLTKKEKIKLGLWLLVYKTFLQWTPHKLNNLRIFILKIFGAKIGKGCFIHQSAMLYMPWNVEIGNYSSIDFDVLLYSWDKIKIGDFVSISYKVNINTASHDYTDPKFKLIKKPILIKSGVFIGTESYVSMGTVIDKMAVIGARSVVTKNIPSSYICFGNPCKPYKKRIQQVHK